MFKLDDGNLKNDVCKGLIFKCKVNNFINSKNEIIFSTRFIPVKKLSCQGCPTCGALMDSLKESLIYGILPLTTTSEDGKLYMLGFSNVSTDWETGQVDDFDLEFFPLE
jgi:hypothetical protein